jgi:hypothetical protein
VGKADQIALVEQIECKCPPSASLAIAPHFSAVIQSTPSSLRIAAICIFEIMPRSPVMTSRSAPKFFFIFSTGGKRAFASAVLPSNADTGQPRLSVRRS